MMAGEKSWNLIENGFNHLKIPYLRISLFLYIILFFIYLFFDFKIDRFNMKDVYSNMHVLIACFLVVYGLAGVQYFIISMKDVFKIVETHIICSRNFQLYDQLKKRFTRSRTFYIINILVIISLFFTNIIDYYRSEKDFLYYSSEPSNWSYGLDIYNIIITILISYLLSNTLWISINISWTLNEIESNPNIKLSTINLFNIDEVGGLRPVRDLILYLFVYTSIFISLLIINFIEPSNLFKYFVEVQFFVILLALGIYLSGHSLLRINKILEDKKRDEIKSVDQLYQKRRQMLQDAILKNKHENCEEEANDILKSIELLRIERERILNSGKVFDFKGFIAFISSSILPIVTFIFKLIFNF